MHRLIARLGVVLTMVAASAGCGAQLNGTAPSSRLAPTQPTVLASAADDVAELPLEHSDELPLDRLVATLPGVAAFSATPVYGQDIVTHVAVRMHRDDASRLLVAISESPELEGFQTESGEDIRQVAAQLADPGSSDYGVFRDLEGQALEPWELAKFQLLIFGVQVEGGLFGVPSSVKDSAGRRFGFTALLPSVAFPDDPADPNFDYTLDLPEPVKSHVIDAYGSLPDDEFIVVVSIEPAR